MSSHYNETAQPANQFKLSPHACKKCENCVRYTLDTKAAKYGDSLPAPLQTILFFTAVDPTEARKFRANAQHNQRMPGARRYSQLGQENITGDERGSTLPCDGLLLWDREASQETITAIEKHARNAGMYNVNIRTMAMDEKTFRNGLPSRLTLTGKHGETIETTRFVRGWAKEAEAEDDLRDGITKRRYLEDGETPIKCCTIPERGRIIGESWRPHFAFMWDRALMPEQREELRRKFIHLLQRARYVNVLDWLYGISLETLEFTKTCILTRMRHGNPPMHLWRAYTRAPQQIIDETAKCMMGERPWEPAFMLVAERVGLIEKQGKPLVEPDFLAELTDQLPPLKSIEGPPVQYDLLRDMMDNSFEAGENTSSDAPYAKYDPFDSYEGMAA